METQYFELPSGRLISITNIKMVGKPHYTEDGNVVFDITYHEFSDLAYSISIEYIDFEHAEEDRNVLIDTLLNNLNVIK